MTPEQKQIMYHAANGVKCKKDDLMDWIYCHPDETEKVHFYLRPLSSLTEPITQGGETFVPIERLLKLSNDTMVNESELKVMLKMIDKVNDYPCWVVDWLLEHHYNVGNLTNVIEVNNKNNPY